MSFKKILISTGFVLVVLAALVLFFEFDVAYRNPGDTITILRGQNALQIANDLKAEGYIASKAVFLAKVFPRGDLRQLKAGEYDLNGLDLDRIVERLVSGKTVAANITIIPGWNIEDIAASLATAKVVAASDFEAAAGPDGAAAQKGEYDFLASLPAAAGLEGFLAPDTYQLPDDAGAVDITKLALDNFDRNLTVAMRADISASKRTVFEVVTMASLLEMEVKTLDDKKLVAGILWKRLVAGMPLQVDSTLLYYKVTGAASGVINKESDSKYNTYRYAGLPAGPICNPGLESIEAAIYPVESEFWYYLSAKDGTTIFSRNYGDHLINKAKYIDNQ